MCNLSIIYVLIFYEIVNISRSIGVALRIFDRKRKFIFKKIIVENW